VTGSDGETEGRRPTVGTAAGSGRRATLIVVLAAVLVGAGIADRLVVRVTPAPVRAAGALSDVRIAPSTGTESSAWYCAGGTGAQGGAPATVIVTNTSTRPVTATLTTVLALATGAQPTAPWAGAHGSALRVPAGGQVAVTAGAPGSTGNVASAVVVNGGGVAVSEEVSSPLGWSMASCASSTAPDWYFAHGATAQGSGLALSLFNPGATDATVDVSLVSPTTGFVSPAAYQGVEVPPGSLVVENVGDHAPQNPAIATEVSTLSGSIVATELDSVGTPGSGGISLTLGSPVPATTWVFAQNTDVAGGTVTFHVLNPSPQPAEVSVRLGLPQGSAAEPLTLMVAGQSVSTLVGQDQTRIPANVPYAVTFSTKGTGIVVTRQVTTPSDQPAPIPEDGDVSGVPGGGLRRWLLPAVVSPGSGAWQLAVVDLGPSPTDVRVLTPTGAAIAGQPERRVVPGTPLIIGPQPGAPFATTPIEIVSGAPVAVELDALPVAGPGVVVVPASAPS